MKPIDKQKQNIELFIKKQNAKFEVFSTLKIVTYETANNNPAMAVWNGNQSKPYINYYYKTKEQMFNRLNETKKNAIDRQEYKEKRMREKKNFVPSLKVNDILVSSWGYEQTNVDYFQVIEVKGKSCKVCKIHHKIVEGSEGFMSCKVLPIKDQFQGEPFNKLILKGNHIKISYSQNAYLWGGDENYMSWYA
jgi:hypothetical protein